MINNKYSPWPSFSKEEIQSVNEVLLSNKVNYWTGNECRKFEKNSQHGPTQNMQYL